MSQINIRKCTLNISLQYLIFKFDIYCKGNNLKNKNKKSALFGLQQKCS